MFVCLFAESTLRRRKARPQASLTATHSSTLAEEIVALLRTLHSLSQWNGLINKYINSQLTSITHIFAGKESEGVVPTSLQSTHLLFLKRKQLIQSIILFSISTVMKFQNSFLNIKFALISHMCIDFYVQKYLNLCAKIFKYIII